MKDKKAAEHYAIGFIEAVGKEHLQTLIQEVNALQVILSENPELKNILTSPLVKDKDKLEIVEPFVSKSEFSVYWQNLIMLLIEKDRLNIFTEITFFLEQYILDGLNIVKVTIKTAHAVNDALQSKIVKHVADKIKKIIEPTFIVDASVIGGFIAESDNFIVDSSVKYSLEKFRLSLINM